MPQTIKHVKVDRSAFDSESFTKSEYSIFFVTEADNTISLYTGSSAVSKDITIVTNLTEVTAPVAGRVYWSKADSTAYIYTDSKFVDMMGTYMPKYTTMPTATEDMNGEVCIFVGSDDENYVTGNVYKVINGQWASISAEGTKLVDTTFDGTTTISTTSESSAGISGFAARADHTHALSDEVKNAIATASTSAITIASHTAAIASNTAAIAVNSTSIASNTAAIAVNSTSIASNTTAIAVNSTSIASNTAAIAVNSTSIASNTAAISVNSASIASNTANIGSLTEVLQWVNA